MKKVLLMLLMVVAGIAVCAGISRVFGVGTSASKTLAAIPASQELGNPDQTFYVVAYHWGWGVFTENGSRLGNITVNKGTVVKIYAVNAHAQKAIATLSPAVSKAINAVDWGKQDYSDGDPQMLWPYMEDHALIIDQYSKVAYLDVNAEQPKTILFRADITGQFEFVCGNYCGYGHKDMPATTLFVKGA